MKTEIGEVTIKHVDLQDLRTKAQAALEEVEKQLGSAEKRLAAAIKERSRLARQRQEFQRFLGLALPAEPKPVPESKDRPQANELSHQQAVRTGIFG